jgi:hypothetical protein
MIQMYNDIFISLLDLLCFACRLLLVRGSSLGIGKVGKFGIIRDLLAAFRMAIFVMVVRKKLAFLYRLHFLVFFATFGLVFQNIAKASLPYDL